ncbi:hypothetical protein OH76DRAFT_1055983 [Lentinus brumalis]|uniref:Uncharacterized protein n=1 Tax=Lentinus brumalis TaxID=2498619 RepID=A0A371DND1_9APHY|nr:hypothetical protein OH76DRAFT_1055983 [Polyporus brumalis]
MKEQGRVQVRRCEPQGCGNRSRSARNGVSAGGCPLATCWQISHRNCHRLSDRCTTKCTSQQIGRDARYRGELGLGLTWKQGWRAPESRGASAPCHNGLAAEAAAPGQAGCPLPSTDSV